MSTHIAASNTDDAYIAKLLATFPKYFTSYQKKHGEAILYVTPDGVVPVLTYLRDHTMAQFKQCIDICGVDFPSRTHRFYVVYNLLRCAGRLRRAAAGPLLPCAPGPGVPLLASETPGPLCQCGLIRPWGLEPFHPLPPRRPDYFSAR